MGVHAELIAKALIPDEGLRYLLYAPIFEADVKPFGIDAKPGSHAIAVTEHRFVISRNPHARVAAPTIQSIPFTHVLAIDFGRALLLGWLAIHFVEHETLLYAALFYPSTGIHHCEAAIHKYRESSPVASYSEPLRRDTHWPGIWEHTPAYQLDLIRSVIVEGERPVGVFRSSEKWKVEKKRRKNMCLATDGTFLITNYGYIHALDETPVRPGILTFGVNIRCIPREVVESVVLKKRGPGPLHLLQLETRCKSATVLYDVPFTSSTIISADGLVEKLMPG